MGVIIFIIILTVFFYRFVAIAWDRCYNLWIFAPLMIAILLISARHCAESLRFAENDAATSLRVKGNSKLISSRQNFATIFISVILLLCSIGYFHSTALFGFYLKYGYQYEEARRDFQKFMSEHPHELIGVSKSLWILSEEYDRMKSFGMTPEHLWRKPNWIVLQQRFALKHSPEPPIFKNYELVSHNFSPYKATLLGLQLSPTMPGYFYAIYRAKKLK